MSYHFNYERFVRNKHEDAVELLSSSVFFFQAYSSLPPSAGPHGPFQFSCSSFTSATSYISREYQRSRASLSIFLSPRGEPTLARREKRSRSWCVLCLIFFYNLPQKMRKHQTRLDLFFYSRIGDCFYQPHVWDFFYVDGTVLLVFIGITWTVRRHHSSQQYSN